MASTEGEIADKVFIPNTSSSEGEAGDCSRAKLGRFSDSEADHLRTLLNDQRLAFETHVDKVIQIVHEKLSKD
ncbi:hypothetical protein KSP40_PGU022284 [Platanthera guangdongensis]|uniref:Uncharacterized protein n=1 Tax=Platanthera guangdongensis TaxID=2320717 RepID=A0ABR2M8Y6_9ASPA